MSTEPKQEILPPEKAPAKQSPVVQISPGTAAVMHLPTQANRDLVLAYAEEGMPQEKIAVLLEVAVGTLRKYYGKELMTGEARQVSVLCKTAMSVAIGRPEVVKEIKRKGKTIRKVIQPAMLPDKTMLIFLLKTRAGYREVSVVENRDGADEIAMGLVGLTESERASRILAILQRGPDRGDQSAADGADDLGADPGQSAADGLRKSG